MKLLLDTHIWIWSLEDPDRLAKKVVAALTDPKNELWLSPVSVWEFVLLVQRGRIELRSGSDPRRWVEESFARAPLHDAPVTREVAVSSRYVSLPHEDPADRFLAATAAVYDLSLVTADERLLQSKGFRTFANR